jgi:hypothetical protein
MNWVTAKCDKCLLQFVVPIFQPFFASFAFFAVEKEGGVMRTMRLLALIGILAPVAVWGAESPQTGGAVAVSYKVEEVPLGPMPDRIFTSAASEDGCHFAFVASKGSKWCVVIDGRAGPEYDRILKGTPVFSPDGKRVAYVAQKGDKLCAVIDGQAGPEYDGIGGLIFSLDGKRVAYAARKGEKWFVVIDGQEGPEYDIVVEGGPVFRPDGTFEYLAVKAGILFRVKHVPVER